MRSYKSNVSSLELQNLINAQSLTVLFFARTPIAVKRGSGVKAFIIYTH